MEPGDRVRIGVYTGTVARVDGALAWVDCDDGHQRRESLRRLTPAGEPEAKHIEAPPATKAVHGPRATKRRK